MNARWVKSIGCAALVAVGCFSCGCISESGSPRMRLGSLPFPGIFSLYEEADPDDMGVHCAGSPLARIGQKGERERGTLYTRRAGFIDVSHLRESIDWVQCLHTRIHASLVALDGDGSAPPGFDFHYCQATFEVAVCRPSWWDGLSVDERTRLIDEASIRLAERMSVVVTTWHEVATWCGHQTVPGVSEQRSAFTWDDTTAHVLGAVIGAKALRRGEPEWDFAVTHAINDELWDLGVLPKRDQRHAADLVGQRWWKNGDAVRRDLEVGLRDGRKSGWLVEELGTDAEVIELPSLSDVDGRDMSSILEMRLLPGGSMRRKLWRGGDAPEVLVGEAGVLEAVERVREQMCKKWGEGFDRP